MFKIIVRKAWLAICISLYLAAAGALRAAYTDPTVTVKTISSSSNEHQPIVLLQTNGQTTATFIATATNFTPTSYTWSQVADTFNSFATAGVAEFTATQTTLPQVAATLPAPGVYQFQVVASDGVNTASRYFWVNVWDSVGALNPNNQVGRNPGIAPPTSERQLSPDPGPFCHPRILFSRGDWPGLNAKLTNSTEVKLAVTNLQTDLAANFDKANSTMRALISVYTNYAAGGYSGTYLTNTVIPAHTAASNILNELIIGHNPSGSYFDALVTACYLAWVGTDPTVAHSAVPATNQMRFNYLATLVAATADVEMNITNNPTAYYSMALCYDLVYDWMTTQQQNDTRDYLYAIGYGYNNTGGGGISRTSTWNGTLQNGDFPNLADGVVLPQLAIEGEESNVLASVQAAFGPTEPYATGPTAWPCASPAAVNNLHRLMNWNTDWYVTPWGFLMNMVDYFQLGQNISAPAALALARRGEDQFVTTYYYQSSLAALYNLSPREDGKGMALFDHHDGLPFTPGPGQLNAAYIVKYMYPDDPMVDYVYRAFRLENENDLAQAIFASDPTNLTLAPIAQAKNLALTKFDPQRAVAVARNGWGENDLNLIFENRFDEDGHMHAERNNFSLYAEGRAWSSPPGYHCTINDLMATVLIQNTNYAGDPATSGYIGQSPSSATEYTNSGYGPPPPGKLLQITADPAGLWTVFAGDASTAYDWGLGTNNSINTGVTQAQNAYPGLLPILAPDTQTQLASTWSVMTTNYNPVLYALRTVLTMRGTNPYVLVIDDINKDGTPHNYRWTMPCAVSFGLSSGRFIDASSNSVYASLTNQTGATCTQAILYHLIDQGTNNQTGLPRLLVQDLNPAASSNQPAMFVENRPTGSSFSNLTYGVDNNSGVFSYVPSSRLMITRTNVVTPNYKILLFPYLTGGQTPATSWSPDGTILTVNLPGGAVDQITLNYSNSDNRTRITGITRSLGFSPPTINLPTNIVVTANTTAPNGQPGGAASFTVTATDYLGNPLTPVLSSPSGTVFPVGVDTVQVSATDSLGQQTSLSFPVTVVPSGPELGVAAIENLSSSGTGYGITLTWPAIYGATGYNVKRSTISGGPYSLISSNQTATTFTDSNLNNTAYFYVVTALLNSYEGTPSVEVPLAPPAANPLKPAYIGTAVGDGVFETASNYLLTCSQGNIPEGNFSEQCTYLEMPWIGDGSFTARLSDVYPSVTGISQFSGFGVMLRQNTNSNTVFAMSGYNTYVAPLFFLYRSVAGSVSGYTNLFGHNTYYPPVWSRLVRSGTNFSAFYSWDGSTWNPIGPSTNILMTTNALVGLAIAPQNTVAVSATYDNIVFLGTPAISTNSSGLTLNWTGALASAFAVQRSTNVNGPFLSLASNLTTTSFSDRSTVPGTIYYYTVTATGPLGGLTASPVVSAGGEPPLLAGFSLSPTNGPVPLTVTFADLSTGSITNRNWNFGDGSSTNTTVTSVVHTFNSFGTNLVTLTVYDPFGGKASASAVVVALGKSTPPLINGLQINNGSLVILGTNGTPGENYLILSSTDLSVPLTNWSILATNQFGPGGSVVFTNPINPGAPQMFYRLLVP